MREIIFKAQRADTKEWVYGNLQYFDNGEYYIKPRYGNKRFGAGYLVIPETIGQFTGLLDKDGVKIFEDDKLLDTLTGAEYIVRFGYNISLGYTGWYLEPINTTGRLTAINADYASEGGVQNSNIKVIGNIHE